MSIIVYHVHYRNIGLDWLTKESRNSSIGLMELPWINLLLAIGDLENQVTALVTRIVLKCMVIGCQENGTTITVHLLGIISAKRNQVPYVIYTTISFLTGKRICLLWKGVRFLEMGFPENTPLWMYIYIYFPQKKVMMLRWTFQKKSYFHLVLEKNRLN